MLELFQRWLGHSSTLSSAALHLTIKSNKTLLKLSVQDSEFNKQQANQLKDAWQVRAMRLREELDDLGDTADCTWRIELNESDTFSFTGRETTGPSARSALAQGTVAAGAFTAGLGAMSGPKLTKEQLLAEQQSLKDLVAAGPPDGTPSAEWVQDIQKRMLALQSAATQLAVDTANRQAAERTEVTAASSFGAAEDSDDSGHDDDD